MLYVALAKSEDQIGSIENYDGWERPFEGTAVAINRAGKNRMNALCLLFRYCNSDPIIFKARSLLPACCLPISIGCCTVHTSGPLENRIENKLNTMLLAKGRRFHMWIYWRMLTRFTQCDSVPVAREAQPKRMSGF